MTAELKASKEKETQMQKEIKLLHKEIDDMRDDFYRLNEEIKKQQESDARLHTKLLTMCAVTGMAVDKMNGEQPQTGRSGGIELRKTAQLVQTLSESPRCKELAKGLPEVSVALKRVILPPTKPTMISNVRLEQPMQIEDNQNYVNRQQENMTEQTGWTQRRKRTRRRGSSSDFAIRPNGDDPRRREDRERPKEKIPPVRR